MEAPAVRMESEQSKSMMVKAKISFGEQSKEFDMPSKVVCFDHVCTLIHEAFNLQYFKVKYVDEENDMVSITSQDDLMEAWNVVSVMGEPLKLCIVVEIADPQHSVKFTIKHFHPRQSSVIELPLAHVENIPIRSGVYLTSLDERKKQGESARSVRWENVPIILEKAWTYPISKDIPLTKQKFLFEKGLTIKALHETLAKQLNLPSQSLDLHVLARTNTGALNFYKLSPSSTIKLFQVYGLYHDVDHFLYIVPSVQ